MGSGAAIGVEVITGEADIMDVAITDEEATTAGVSQPADAVASAADVAALAAVDAVGLTADVAALAAVDAVGLTADVAALAAVDVAASAADVVEVDSTAAAVVPMAGAMVGATGN
jgi:hypothetical protein